MENNDNNIEQNNSDDAGERFRRLISSIENADPGAVTPPIRRKKEPNETIENEDTAKTDESNLQESSQEQETSKEKPIDSRHPTGAPDQTAGWFAADIDDLQKDKPEKEQSGPPSDSSESGDSDQVWQSRYDLGSRPWPVESENASQNKSEPEMEKTKPAVPFDEMETIPPPPGATQPFLPNRVNEFDTQATRVSPVAYGGYPPPQQYTEMTQPNVIDSKKKKKKKVRAESDGGGFRSGLGCFLKVAVGGLFLLILLAIIAGSLGVYQYFKIADGLPDVKDLRERAAKFETTRILDRNGNVIYEILDPNAGRRTYVPLEDISPFLIAATIATEDKEYYNHPGFDPVAVARAFWQNYTAGDIVSGASTITQQLARMLLLDDTERFTRTYERKAREIVLAAEITRNYSKEEILELFLNENNYGNLAYGIEAAAETYFNTTAGNLTLAQASFLAGLPQAPAVYDIYTNREATLNRHKQVLILMYRLSAEKNCIYVGNGLEDVCVNEVASAAEEIENYQFVPHDYSMRYPHWVNYIRAQLEEQFDPQTIYRSGFTVYTTLDPSLQEKAQQIVTNQVAQLADKNATNGALIAIRPASGEILAMVGSADFNNEAISGQVNMSIAPRQPGSSIKPLVYLAAFEKGWTPSTLIWDIPTGFSPSGDPNDPRPPYEPVNYDGRFHGPATVRSALANSFNIPAVKALDFVKIYDDPTTSQEDGFINFAERVGISTLTRDDYGLSLSLGGGNVTLLEMTKVYATLANNGLQVPPVAITKIVDHLGNVVYEYQQPAGDLVVRAEHAYLISSIISDNQARSPMFGANSVLNLPFQAAAKTGTTNDFRDNWTLGYTPDIAIGVWVGNADYSPMQNTSGLSGAAPIWAEAMQMMINQITGGNPSSFVRPAGVVDRVICSVSGTEPSQWCPSQRSEMFAYDQLPAPQSEDLWQKMNIDTWTGLKASAACSDFTKEEFVLNVTDPLAVKWIKESSQGQAWAQSIGFDSPVLFAPERECQIDDSRPKIIFAGITEGQEITANPFDIYAVVNATSNYKKMRLEYGRGSDPNDWKLLYEADRSFNDVEKIYTWDLFEDEIEPGEYTLRITIENQNDGYYAEKKIRVRINAATPTPTATETFTVTPTPTLTLTPTPTFTPTPTSPATATNPPPTITPTPPAPTISPTPLPPSPEPTADVAPSLTPSSTTAPTTAATVEPTGVPTTGSTLDPTTIAATP
ncbi:MAG: hypothetical protein CL609_13810 [Anaerolineaceae bacterium]|nr:hypothetical protein [Anaerolineaceae bacterium]